MSLTKITFVVVLFACSTLFCRAEDWTASNGKVYRGVTVLSHTSTKITILYADGGATLNLADLPSDIRNRYGFDAKAAAIEKAKEDAAAAQEAADLKAKQDAQAAADKADREAKAADIVATAKEETEDEKHLDSLNQQAKSDYASMDKLPVDSQATATRNGETLKLGKMHVRLYSEDQARAALEILADKGGDDEKSMEPILADEKAKCMKLNAAIASAKGAAHDAAVKTYADAAKEYRDALMKYYASSSQTYYAEKLPAPVAEAVTDEEGKFTMQMPKTGSWVLVAQGQRALGDATENYLWIAKISSEAIVKNQVALNDGNLSGVDSLLTGLSNSDVATLVQTRIDETTQK